MKEILISTGIALFSLASFGAAQTGGFVQEEPHEHGAASLSVVLDGETLNMEFVSPAVNLVGFEYEPATSEEEAAVEDALAQLEDGAALFSPAEAAGCELSDQEVEREVTSEEGHSEDGHEEGEEHGDEETGGADDHSDEEGEEGAVHSEFHATYTFTCAQPDSLDSVSLRELFALYPGIEDLDVQYVLPERAGCGGAKPDDGYAAYVLRSNELKAMSNEFW